MKNKSKSEKLILEEITSNAHKLKNCTRGLEIGEIIALIRKQLGMSQQALARRANVPQSTISRTESSQRPPNLSTLKKILEALSCQILIVPLLMEPIDALRKKQAKYVALKSARYLQGTMSLEQQEPDLKLLEEIIKEEEEELLRSPSNKLWQE